MEFLTKEFIYQKSSQEITSLLYEACINNLEEAISNINQKNYMDVNRQLQKVNDLLERLGVGINYEAGIIADQLDALYNYMANRVIEANMKKDAAMLEEVLRICEALASAWNTAMKNNVNQNQSALKKTNAYEQQIRILDRNPY
ncbi:flagellar export chaperone FliS [Cytobacillus dafuensis]|uniref:Flagellar export chaperone FliS n=1 Tax=Cytobacillus dafuensis TaxID=1742359 RepID=A0A5B8Z912_CYTDA|nr:flagellar export chaperone FliS [Cytobacillus dafuensis]QED49605.1 flagellar export chaperone FliS [Cytobacillus dafuensis]